VLISHAKAVDLYRKKYQPTQHGKISIVNIMEWSEPMTQDPEDIEAAQIRNDLGFGWWVDPVYTGDYPESMKAKLWILLPKFTEEDKKLLKGSTDYFGLNHYTTQMTARPSFKRFNTSDGMPSTPLSRFVSQHYDVNGTLIGDPSATFWLFDVPWGLKHTLQYIKRKYDNPDIYITENGYPVIDEYKKEFKDRTHDPKRIKYYAGYLNAMQEAIKESGVKVKSYFAWTLMDNFEWQEGFTVPFGTTSFDRSNNKRYLKDSFYYLRDYFTKAIQK
jgi:beta-glucosidase